MKVLSQGVVRMAAGEFLLSASPTKFADLKALADKSGAMTPFAINAKVTITVDNTFEVVSQQLAHNDGADDGSGSATLMGVARAFATGPRPQRSIVLIWHAGENDPADPEGVYTRSDHYSYASKGIPVAFFTTGLHQQGTAGRLRQ